MSQEAGVRTLREEVLNKVPCPVRTVRVSGNDHTTDDFFQQRIAKSGVKEAKTFGELAQRVRSLHSDLKSSGVFERVEVNLGASPIPEGTTQKQPSTDIDVVVKERKRVGARAEIFTEVNTGDVGVKFGGLLRNVTGKADQLEGSITSTNNGRVNEFEAGYVIPYAFNAKSVNQRIRMALFKQNRSLARYNSLNIDQVGGTVAFQEASGRWEVSYELSQRRVNPAPMNEPNRGLWESVKSGFGLFPSSSAASSSQPDSLASPLNPSFVNAPYAGQYTQPASETVLASAQSSLKSALKVTYTLDGRDDPFAPTIGPYAQASLELAGLGGDVNFTRTELDLQQHIRITPTLSVGLGGLFGLVTPFSPFTPKGHTNTFLNVIDTLSAGGPLMMRGFAPFGLGPKDLHDSVGGDLFGAFSANLSWLLPIKALQPYNVRANMFFNAGNLTNRQGTSFNAFLAGVRRSVGAGVLFPSPLGRFELNIIAPLAHAPTDTINRFQVGLGWRFM